MSQPTHAEAVAAVRAFIGAEPPQGRSAFIISLDARGNPSVRQVSTYIEGWTVWTVSQAGSLKVRHLRADPRASYLWVEDQPQRRRKNVWLRGRVTVVNAPEEVAAFLERRSRTLGFRVPERDWQRVVLRFQPEYLRAEGFLGEEAGNTPVILRKADFQALVGQATA
jgi:hypothetical protein